jgi:adenylylsulfate kinase
MSFAVWITGLPAAGKSTLATLLRDKLQENGHQPVVLDSDDLRPVLTPRPHYDREERDWLYSVIAFLAQLMTEHGVEVIIAATAPRRAHRDGARKNIARFYEVYAKCSPETCSQRDPKGLWKKARNGDISTLPGHGSSYEEPRSPELRLDTDQLNPRQCVDAIIRMVQA